MTNGNMKIRTPRKKLPNDYPRVCFRIDAGLLKDLNSVKEETDLSYGQIISQALRRYVPELAKFHKGERAS